MKSMDETLHATIMNINTSLVDQVRRNAGTKKNMTYEQKKSLRNAAFKINSVLFFLLVKLA